MSYSRLLARADTPIGELVLLRRQLQADPTSTFVELLVDDRVLMSDFNSLSERALARMGIARHPGEELRVLVGGLGLGHTAHQALASPRVAVVDVIEFVPVVAEWFEQGLVPLSKELRDDSRFQVIIDDVYARLAKDPTERYDLILVDVDHAPDDPLLDDSAAFYTPKGLRRAAEHLQPGGILAVWSCAENGPFAETLREVFAKVEVETTLFQDDWFNAEDETNWLFFASQPKG